MITKATLDLAYGLIFFSFCFQCNEIFSISCLRKSSTIYASVLMLG